ncbi:MAG: hypothetical protein M3Q60_20250 [Actinomycetota bacterium]|jgi:hypothetical protein|nr:hypothetical protein [Actinomycetota bacterium]
MLESVTGGFMRRPRYWTIVRNGSSHVDVFAVDPDERGEALAVFGFEEEAELFLCLAEMGAGWQAHETTAGELVSILYGPCANVERVVLDPLPRGISGSTGMRPLCVRSADFASAMVDVGAARAGAIPALAALRP